MEGSSEISSSEQAALRFERQQELEEIRERYKKTADALNFPIEDGILEPLVGLHSHVVGTSGSCEGHTDRALALPWIDISAPHLSGWEKDPAIRQKMKEMSERYVRTGQAVYEHWKVVRQEEGRPLTSEEELIFDPIGTIGAARLESPHQNEISSLDIVGRTEKSMVYKQAMKEFGEFMKMDFLEHGSMFERILHSKPE